VANPVGCHDDPFWKEIVWTGIRPIFIALDDLIRWHSAPDT
jgi:hypothetical protein